MYLEKVSLEEFKKIGEELHLICFGEKRDKDFNTFDFALVVMNDKEPVAYATCIEHDKESLYMQHGGALPGGKGTSLIAKAYFMMINWIKENYKNTFTQILNLNVPMLKLALSAGFIITGAVLYQDGVWLQLLNDFTEGAKA